MFHLDIMNKKQTNKEKAANSHGSVVITCKKFAHYFMGQYYSHSAVSSIQITRVIITQNLISDC